MKTFAPLAAALAFFFAACASSEEVPATTPAPEQYITVSLAKLIQLPSTHLGQPVETQGLLIALPVEFKKDRIVCELTPDGGRRNGRIQVVASVRHYDILATALAQNRPVHVRGRMLQDSSVSAQHPILQLSALGVAEK